MKKMMKYYNAPQMETIGVDADVIRTSAGLTMYGQDGVGKVDSNGVYNYQELFGNGN